MIKKISEELKYILLNTKYYSRIFDGNRSIVFSETVAELERLHAYKIYSDRFRMSKLKLTDSKANFYGYEELLRNVENSKDSKVLIYKVKDINIIYLIFCESKTKKLLGVIEKIIDGNR